MIWYSERCQRYYVVKRTGCWRFLKTLETRAFLLRLEQVAREQVARAAQVKRQRIAATGGFPLRHTDRTPSQERAARTARAFYGQELR